MAGFDPDNSVIIPYNSIMSVIDVKSNEYEPSLVVKAYNANNVTEVRDEARGILRRQHKIRPDRPDDFTVNQLTGISKMLDGLFAQIKIAGWVIGCFSLLVGAFGIANIMFVTVKERTKVIGLKKAIGARKASIQLEFLSESVVLCLVGGLIGILLVLLISLAVSKGFDLEVVLSVKNFFIGVFVSIFVGILSGFIPARSASRLDPVVAIRTN
jgi:putative ABC transport system permease protein